MRINRDTFTQTTANVQFQFLCSDHVNSARSGTLWSRAAYASCLARLSVTDTLVDNPSGLSSRSFQAVKRAALFLRGPAQLAKLFAILDVASRKCR